MKKIIISMMAVAALAACSKSEVQYEPDGEIAFAPVSKLNTKAAVTTTDYPDALNMYVFANAGETTDALPAGYDEPYFANAEFTHTQRTDITLATNVFAGVTPYYWPNVKKLIFSGYSKSGNVALMNPKPTYKWNTYEVDGVTVRKAWEIEMQGYAPGNGTTTLGNNDLMWFPTTAQSYGKADMQGADKEVEVVMQHACSWVTINVKGDATTGKTGTTWQILDLTINDLAQKGDVILGATADWTPSAETSAFKVFNGEKALTTGYVDYTQLSYTDLILVPQETKTLTITYEFVSQAGLDPIQEVKTIDLTYTNDEGWKPGVHYTYNITIGTQEILIEPTVKVWETVTAPDVVLQ